MLPRVLAGSSVGSVVCALVSTRTDSELAAMLATSQLAEFDLSFFSSATAPQLVGHLLARVSWLACGGWWRLIGGLGGWAGWLGAAVSALSAPPVALCLCRRHVPRSRAGSVHLLLFSSFLPTIPWWFRAPTVYAALIPGPLPSPPSLPAL